MNKIAPRSAYHCQRGRARIRGVDWNLTFDEWWKIWQDSGHWEQRGRSWQSYVMCRVGDSGPYEVGNVFIATNIENVSSAQRKLTGLPVGVYQKRKAWCAKRQVDGKHIYLGTFPTPELAHAAYLQSMVANTNFGTVPVLGEVS